MKYAKVLVLSVSLLVSTVCAYTQTIQERLSQKKPSCREVLSNASSLLPELYSQSAFDSLEKAVHIMQKSCTGTNEVFYLTTLLAIQQSYFSVNNNIDSSFMQRLKSYVSQTRFFRNTNIKVYNQDEYQLISFIKQWAADLGKKKDITNDERFLCYVLAGNVANPEKELRLHKSECPGLYGLLKQSFVNDRNGGRFTSAFIAGIWIPGKDLSILGPHPSFGFSIGGRNRNDEFDLTFQFRFLNAKNSYEILRQNNLYSRKNYFGGYIGIDYTRYIIHQTRYEFGLLGGGGYDGFDVTENNNNNSNNYLKPLSINSLNGNLGLRMNYFFNARSFIGVQSRYNFINYKNKGGTSLNGNALSIDLIFGGNSKTYN